MANAGALVARVDEVAQPEGSAMEHHIDCPAPYKLHSSCHTKNCP